MSRHDRHPRCLCGLAHSHPFTDAANLVRLKEQNVEVDVVGVYDSDASQADIFAERFACTAASTLEALITLDADLFIVTARPHEITVYAETLLRETSEPLFFNKVVAANHTQLTNWIAAIDSAPERVGTASVLRFAPRVRELAEQITGAEIWGLRILVQHDIAMFLAEDRRWQDDPELGGGTLVTVGTHAWEIVDQLLPQATLASSAHGWIHHALNSASSSEETAQLTGSLVTPEGESVRFALTVTGTPGPEVYAVDVFTSTGTQSLILSSANTHDSLGFVELADELVRNAQLGRTTAPWNSAQTIVANTIHAALTLREFHRTEKSSRND
ncbi:hypothetical protein [Rhodoglobus aureus]|uniref:Gfo/Idh/MocA-like oxidoreductase N-terminal domain-containing protein n=1 Tax=Rhodoglobus aureus TaxID=191497 RepID=A0ABN1VGJ0_9MICO